MPRCLAVIALALAAACSDRAIGGGEGGSGEVGADATAASTPMTSTGTSPTTEGSTATTSGAVTTDGSVSADGESAGMVMHPDGGAGPLDCDLFASDECAEGEKCMPWANDGGSQWNSAHCAPLDPDPDARGEPCVVERSAVSGIDTCELGAMCWHVDAQTNTGTCVAFCTGSAARPTCDGPDLDCIIMNDGVLPLCLQTCDPLAQACAFPGEACYPSTYEFVCAPEGLGEPLGFGEPCDHPNECAAGLFCAEPETVPGCDAAERGCCSQFCDLNLLDDSQCAGFADGQLCYPWYTYEAAPGLEDVGACALPP